MIYNTVSARVVIARVLRNTRLTDLTYANDILEWLNEAVNRMRTRHQLVPDNKVLKVVDHIAKLPCGLVTIDGIYYNGQRLRLGIGATDTRVKFFKNTTPAESYFASDPTDEAYQNTQDYKLVRGQDLKMATTSNSQDYYITYPNHIQTSFQYGNVILLFRKQIVDDEGYPMIPDNEHFELACFWYIMGMLAMTGYKHNDPKMDYDYCDQQFLKYSRIAKNKIRIPSEDRRESMKEMFVNLIPPQGYYETFSIGLEQPKHLSI